jgi:hypothetical protein
LFLIVFQACHSLPFLHNIVSFVLGMCKSDFLVPDEECDSSHNMRIRILFGRFISSSVIPVYKSSFFLALYRSVSSCSPEWKMIPSATQLKSRKNKYWMACYM